MFIFYFFWSTGSVIDVLLCWGPQHEPYLNMYTCPPKEWMQTYVRIGHAHSTRTFFTCLPAHFCVYRGMIKQLSLRALSIYTFTVHTRTFTNAYYSILLMIRRRGAPRKPLCTSHDCLQHLVSSLISPPPRYVLQAQLWKNMGSLFPSSPLPAMNSSSFKNYVNESEWRSSNMLRHCCIPLFFLGYVMTCSFFVRMKVWQCFLQCRPPITCFILWRTRAQADGPQ